VAPPFISTTLYLWQQLIKNPKYFPIADPTSSSGISNAEILEFLKESASEAAPAVALASLAGAALKQWGGRDLPAFKLQSFSQKMARIAKIAKSPIIQGIANSVAGELKDWPHSNPAAITQWVAELNTELSDVPPGSSFFASLENLQFRGTLHCEACLATLITKAADLRQHIGEYAELLPKLQVNTLLRPLFAKHPFFFYENSLTVEFLGYQNAAVLFAWFSSTSWQKTAAAIHLSYEAPTLLSRLALYRHGLPAQSWTRWLKFMEPSSEKISPPC